MNNSKTPKIVVGVGLVVAYAAGLAFLTVRDDNAITQSPPSAVSAQTVAAPASAGTLASTDAPSPEAIAPVMTAAPVAPEATDAAKAAEAKRPAVVFTPKPRVEDVPVASLPSPRAPAPNDVEASSRSNSGSNAVSELAPAADSVASESVTSAVDKPSGQEARGSTETAPSSIDN